MQQFAECVETPPIAMYWPWTICILLATGLFFTHSHAASCRSAGFPRPSARWWPRSKPAPAGAVSPFQAFMTGLAATIGVGNIAGVATAIISGGPGALFWIWCYGFFATAIKFAEAALGLKFRIARGEQTLAGPMYYLRDGLRLAGARLDLRLIAGVAVPVDDAVHAAQLDRRRPRQPAQAARRSA